MGMHRVSVYSFLYMFSARQQFHQHCILYISCNYCNADPDNFSSGGLLDA